MNNTQKMYDAFSRIELEIKVARKKFPPFRNQHEAYAVILEELDEYWDKVKRDEDGKDELIQVAAMCITAIMET